MIPTGGSARSPFVSAPGKAFLIGEYLALHGGPALLVAVNRRAVARLSPEGLQSPLLLAALVGASRVGGATQFSGGDPVAVDTSPFERDGLKLGLGSSAAVAVAAVGLMFATRRWDPRDHRPLIFQVADAAHRRAQGEQGSGADIATSVYGGAVLFQRRSGCQMSLSDGNRVRPKNDDPR